MSTQYRKAVTPTTKRNADPAYQAVSRAASDQGPRREAAASAAFFEDIACATHGVNELLFERVVRLRAQAADVDVDDIGLAIQIDAPDLSGNESARQDLPGPA